MPSYPLSLPSSPGPSKANVFQDTLAAISRSPYTGKGQVYDWGVDLFRLHLEFPVMKEDQAQDWIQFLRDLRGVVGTFLYDVHELIANTPGSSGGTSGDSSIRTFRLIDPLSQWEVDEHRNYTIIIDAIEEPNG